MKVTLWGKEVDLDYPNVESFLSTEELEKIEALLPSCKHEWIKSKSDNWLHCRKFLPEVEPKAIIVFCHGIQTHSGVAIEVEGRKLGMALLVEHYVHLQGYALYALDLLGHGFSEGVRSFIPDYVIHRDDLNTFANLARMDYPSLPLFLMGHSYGATLSVHVASDYWQDKPDFGGVLLLSTATKGDLPPAIVVFILADVLAKCFPQKSPFFMPNPVSSERVWKDKEVLAIMTSALHRKIDKSGTPFRLGTAAGLLKATGDVRTKAIPQLKAPFCAIHGTDDFAVPISDMEYLAEHAGTLDQHQTCVRIEGAYHDMLGDPSAEEALEHFDTFIHQQIERLRDVLADTIRT